MVADGLMVALMAFGFVALYMVMHDRAERRERRRKEWLRSLEDDSK